jgi:hypothetical protein
MVGKNNAALIARIGALTTPKITEGKSIDFAGAVDAWRESREKAEQREQKQLAEQKKQAYIKALQGGNQDEINSALADYNPDAYAQMLKSDAQRAEDRKWALDDMATKHRYDLELAKAKDKEFTTAQRNMAYLQEMGYSPKEAAMLVYGGQNPSLDMALLGKKGQEAHDKKIGEMIAEQKIAEQQAQELEPRVKQALERAKESLKEGTGLGQFGGWGWTTEQGGINRANVSNAQSQINTSLRGLLKKLGVGSTELNSAAEAEAYRYAVKPDMPVSQQIQVLNNFEKDYLNGDLQKELSKTYGNPSLKNFNQSNEQQAISDGTIIQDANGNKMILRGGQWQAM